MTTEEKSKIADLATKSKKMYDDAWVKAGGKSNHAILRGTTPCFGWTIWRTTSSASTAGRVSGSLERDW